MRSTVVHSSHAYDRDLAEQNPPDQRVSFRVFDRMLHDPFLHFLAFKNSEKWKWNPEKWLTLKNS